MNSVRKPVVFTCLEILSHFLASVVQCQLHWHITTSSSVNCLENFKYNRTWRLSCYIVQHFWARTSTSLWNNRKEKQSLTISSLQCAVRGSCPHVENVQESANWKFWKPFRKKWLYTYIHAWCVCLYSLYKEFCLFPGLTHQLSQSWHWQQTSVVVLTLRWEVLALPCLLNSIPSFLFAWLWEKRHGKRSLHCYRSWWAFPYVHLEVLYSYQCSEINIPKGFSVPIHTDLFDGSVWFQSWSWMFYRVGSGNLHLLGYGRKLLWNLRKIWVVSLLSNDKTDFIFLLLAEHCGIYWQ